MNSNLIYVRGAALKHVLVSLRWKTMLVPLFHLYPMLQLNLRTRHGSAAPPSLVFQVTTIPSRSRSPTTKWETVQRVQRIVNLQLLHQPRRTMGQVPTQSPREVEIPHVILPQSWRNRSKVRCPGNWPQDFLPNALGRWLLELKDNSLCIAFVS